MIKKVLVTGISGYIGRAVARHLSNCGYEVTGVCRRRVREGGIRILQIDLSNHFDIGESFDIIVHAAGELPKRNSELWQYDAQEFLRFKRNNVDTMQNILEFAKEHSVPKMIYFSTIGVYGRMDGGIINEESDRINPDAYGITKYMAEMLLKECDFIEGISLRMPGVIGPGAKNVWLTNIVEKMRNGDAITIYSPEFETKNFVWIDNLSEFVRQLIEMDEWKHDALVLACKQGASIRKIVDVALECTGSRSPVIVNDGMRKPFCLDAARAHGMGYESIDPLEIARRYCVQI